MNLLKEITLLETTFSNLQPIHNQSVFVQSRPIYVAMTSKKIALNIHYHFKSNQNAG